MGQDSWKEGAHVLQTPGDPVVGLQAPGQGGPRTPGFSPRGGSVSPPWGGSPDSLHTLCLTNPSSAPSPRTLLPPHPSILGCSVWGLPSGRWGSASSDPGSPALGHWGGGAGAPCPPDGDTGSGEAQSQGAVPGPALCIQHPCWADPSEGRGEEGRCPHPGAPREERGFPAVAGGQLGGAARGWGLGSRLLGSPRGLSPRPLPVETLWILGKRDFRRPSSSRILEGGISDAGVPGRPGFRWA